tara:strand:+ start:268 stop:1452 length:1185 start_codon:yes stop_codon:yes gene_type:complete
MSQSRKPKLSAYACQNVTETDIKSVCEILASDYLTQGPATVEFESKIANYIGVPTAENVSVVSSGTAALHLACLSLNVGANTNVWVPSISFVATANAPKLCGASVNFCDCNSLDGTLDLDSLEQKLIRADQIGILPDVLMIVHLGGLPMQIERILALKKQFGFMLIEDACHAFGAEYQDGTIVGSCSEIEVTTFSFHAIKNLTTAEGGAVVSTNTNVSERVKVLRSHGVVKGVDAKRPWIYDQAEIGLNYRLSDLQCSLGLSQLSRALESKLYRQKIAKSYIKSFDKMLSQSVFREMPEYKSVERSVWHLFRISLADHAKRDEIIKALTVHEIGFSVNYRPIPLNSFWRECVEISDYQNALIYSETTLSLPIHLKMEPKDAEYVASIVQSSIFN